METKETLEHRVALLVDGPNMYRTDNREIVKTAENYGRIMIKEVFLTKDAPGPLIESFIRAGYQPIINCIKDVDTSLAIRATEIVCSPRYEGIDLIAIASGDVDYLSLFQKSRFYDKKVLVIGAEKGNGMSYTMKRNSDYFESVLEKP